MDADKSERVFDLEERTFQFARLEPERQALLQEATELTRIFGAIFRKSS
jgi:hypothetical protein